MKIWLVSLFEQTPLDDNKDTRFNNIANVALENGHKVIFWSSTFRHNIKKQRFEKTTVKEINNSFKLIFVKSKPYKKNISLKRLYSHGIMAGDLLKEFEKVQEKPDVILLAFPPISTAYKVVSWASTNNIPIVIDIIDPWPDIFKAYFKKIPRFLLDILFYPFSAKVKSVFSKMDAVTAISNQYLDWAKSFNPGIQNMRCFYPAVNFETIKKSIEKATLNVKKDSNTLRIIYAGSLGYSYDIPTILKAAELLEIKYKDINFIIAGDGPQKPLITDYLRSHSNLEYLGRIPKDKLMEEYYLADLGLTQHVKGASQSVTYKLFDLLAAGLPILNSLESEMKDIILNNKVGMFNAPGDAAQLADNIEKFYNNRNILEQYRQDGFKLTAKEGDSKVVYENFLKFLENVSSSSLAK